MLPDQTSERSSRDRSSTSRASVGGATAQKDAADSTSSGFLKVPNLVLQARHDVSPRAFLVLLYVVERLSLVERTTGQRPRAVVIPFTHFVRGNPKVPWDRGSGLGGDQAVSVAIRALESGGWLLVTRHQATRQPGIPLTGDGRPPLSRRPNEYALGPRLLSAIAPETRAMVVADVAAIAPESGAMDGASQHSIAPKSRAIVAPENGATKSLIALDPGAIVAPKMMGHDQKRKTCIQQQQDPPSPAPGPAVAAAAKCVHVFLDDDPLVPRLREIGVDPFRLKALSRDQIADQLAAMPYRSAGDPAKLLAAAVKDRWQYPPQLLEDALNPRLPSPAGVSPRLVAWSNRAREAHSAHRHSVALWQSLHSDEQDAIEDQARQRVESDWPEVNVAAPDGVILVGCAMDIIVAERAAAKR